jgi:hypothetical protein
MNLVYFNFLKINSLNDFIDYANIFGIKHNMEIN